ncbi:MAG TPA: TIGR02587 family membrane protein [Candidatus Kapabacteria bacterium]|nr:TIGR02587 family membrane protein [Candidatus Kapabacteria bacterium]
MQPLHISNEWKQELHEYLRGLSGAFLLGIPLLYTMEMWWIGEYLATSHLLSLLGFALLINYALASVGGFRRSKPILGNLEEALDAVAIGAVGSLLVLAVLNRISWHEPFESNLGMLVLQTVPLSIGASVSNILFARVADEDNGDDEPRSHQHHRAKNSTVWQRTLTDIGATIAGAVIIGFSIAPTEEIPMLANELGWLHELSLIAISLIITYAIVFASGFDPQGEMQDHGIFQHPASETTISYIVSLGLSFVMLMLFDQVSLDNPLSNTVSQVLVLGLPTAIGGAAGRVAI